MEKNMLPNDVARAVSLLLEDLGTPISLSVAIKLRYGMWDEISDVSLDPRCYLDADRYFADVSAVSILKKCADLPTSKEKRRQRCVDKWWEGEMDCFRSNERLVRYLSRHANADDRVDAISGFFSDVRKIVRSWIGDAPPDLLEGRFGPGATYADRGGKTTVPDKINNTPTLTRDAVWFLPQWLGNQWGASVAQHHGEISFVPGNRFATVPKTAKIDRAIASEPSINGFFQLAMGRALRRRLRNATGWNLTHAQEIHRQVACRSSASREFATLDLSNASDTVSRVLVELLLPHKWYGLLDDLRSKRTLIDDKWVVLEKFSSMGNGFTFELETIIFAALSCCVSQRLGHPGRLGMDVFVYGDDIIVKDDVVKGLKSVLEFCGFKLNEEKSFFGDVPFRESCGGDYFAGQPVRPFFLKDFPNEPQDAIVFANGISALLERGRPLGRSISRRAWFAVLDSIPWWVRSCRGPQVLGDIVIHDEQQHWTVKQRHSIRYIRCYRPHKYRIKRYDRFNAEVVLACATYGGTDNVRLGGVIPRNGVRSFKVGWVPYS